jgi:hypothetical protein
LLYLQTAFSANRDIVNKEVEEFNDWLKQQKVQPILIPETLVDAPIKRKVTEEDKFNTVYSSLCVAYQISWIIQNH